MFSKWSERKEWSVEPPHYRKSWHNPPSQSAVRKQGREYQLLKRVAQAFCDCDWDVTGRTLLFFCFWKNIIVVQYGLFVDLRPLGDAVIKLFWGKLNLMEISVSVIYPEIWFKPLTLIHVPYDVICNVQFSLHESDCQLFVIFIDLSVLGKLPYLCPTTPIIFLKLGNRTHVRFAVYFGLAANRHDCVCKHFFTSHKSSLKK